MDASTHPARTQGDDDESDEDEVPSHSPNGLFHLPSGSVRVQDADEEVMELYMSLASTSPAAKADTGGLGFLDSASDLLELDLVLQPPSSPMGTETGAGAPPLPSTIKATRKVGKAREVREVKVAVRLQQDIAAVKGRKGDTGSVLWRSSLHLAKHILQQHHFPPANSPALLDPARLRSARILELGTGTGLLAILLSPLCASYTASDQYDNLKLIGRNVALNLPPQSVAARKGRGAAAKGKEAAEGGGRVKVEEVDWVAVHAERQKRETRPPSDRDDEGYDMVLAVDCIYNENLVQPLVSTLARYCPRRGRTVVWVVVELRSADVMTTFLDTWLNDPSGPWTIIRIPPQSMGRWDGQRPRWVGWVAWR